MARRGALRRRRAGHGSREREKPARRLWRGRPRTHRTAAPREPAALGGGFPAPENARAGHAPSVKTGGTPAQTLHDTALSIAPVAPRPSPSQELFPAPGERAHTPPA